MNGNNFVAQIAEAYRALEEQPKLIERIHSLENQSKEDGETIAKREQRIMELNAKLEEMTAKLRSVEAERDEAGFRLLEAEDRVSTTAKAFESLQGAIASLSDSFKKPEPEPVKQPEPEAQQGQSEQSPSPASDQSAGQTSASQASDSHSGGGGSKGQSATDPTPAAATQEGESSSAEGSGNSDSVQASQSSQEQHSPQEVGQADPTRGTQSVSGTESQSDSASFNAGSGSNASGPYSGKRYIDVPGYVSRQDWIAGGGTEADYDYRH